MGVRGAWPAGMGVERQPVLHPPAVASSRMGSSAWPRRRGVVGRSEGADLDFLDLLEALQS